MESIEQPIDGLTRIAPDVMDTNDKSGLIDTDRSNRSVPNGDSPGAESSPLHQLKTTNSILYGPQNRGLRIIIIVSLVFSLAVTMALILTIYLEPKQVHGHAAVACDDVRCSQIGLDVLKDGGNSVDAAVAVAFCLGVVNPAHSGIGGGGFALVHDHKYKSSYAYNFREVAPSKLPVAELKNTKAEEWRKSLLLGNIHNKVVHQIPELVDWTIMNHSRDAQIIVLFDIPCAQNTEEHRNRYRMNRELSIHSTGVPGFVKGLSSLHQRHGRIPWKNLVLSAVELADKGFNVSQELAFLLKNAGTFDDSELKKIFTKPNGELKDVNDRITWPELAKTLQKVAINPDSFYSGDLMKDFVKNLTHQGSFITEEDMKNYTVVMPEVLRTKFKDLTVVSLPPPAGGALVALILKMADKVGWKSNQGNSSLTYHQLIEIYKFAYAHQALLGDPEVNPQMVNTTQELLSDQFVGQLVEKINDTTTFNSSSNYGPFLPSTSSGTTHFSVIDSAELMVSITLSLNYNFGNKKTVNGIVLNNHLMDFDLDSSTSANSFANSKRPQSYMSPTVLFNDEHPCDHRLILGGSGGNKISTSVSETIINSVIFQQNLSSAICAPRVHNNLDIVTFIESGISDTVQIELKDRNHNLQVLTLQQSAGVNGIEKTNDVILAYSDYRKFGGPAFY